MKKAAPMFVIAIILIMAALFRLPEGVRNVDIVSLLGVGITAGILLMRGITTIRAG